MSSSCQSHNTNTEYTFAHIWKLLYINYGLANEQLYTNAFEASGIVLVLYYVYKTQHIVQGDGRFLRQEMFQVSVVLLSHRFYATTVISAMLCNYINIIEFRCLLKVIDVVQVGDYAYLFATYYIIDTSLNTFY